MGLSKKLWAIDSKGTWRPIYCIAMAITQADLMTEPSVDVCNVAGLSFLAKAATEEEVCTRFERALFAAKDPENGGEGLSVSISIDQAGSIDALVTITSPDRADRTLEAAIDVMDRGLRSSDIDRLAQVIAELWNAREPRPSQPSSDKNRTERL